MKRIASPAPQGDALGAYYAQIRRSELLTAEQEKELSKRIQAGDMEAKQVLIESNLRLVVKIAKSYVSHDTSLLDLIQDGNLGLLKAAAKFDYRKDVRFSTYAGMVDQAGDHSRACQPSTQHPLAASQRRCAEADSTCVFVPESAKCAHTDDQ